LETYALYSYTSATIAYFLLLGLILIHINKSEFGKVSAVAVLCSIVWTTYTVFVLQNDSFYIQDIFPVESLRNLAWFFLISALISKQQFDDKYYFLKASWKIAIIVCFILGIVALEFLADLRYPLQKIIGFDFRPLVHIGFSLLGLILIEQLYRNAAQEQRWAIKFICIGLSVIFAIDFVFYSKSLLFNQLDSLLWQLRGVINFLVVPLLAISLHRLNQNQIKIKVSNKLIFHSTVLLGAGLYLLIMSFVGYYIKIYGGNWGTIAQVSFIFLAIILLLVFFISGKIRALAKVYFSKHFYQQRYDYREEWIKLSKKIAELDDLDDLTHLIVKTMANIVDSSAGGLWVKNSQGDYYLTADLSLGKNSKQLVNENDKLIQFISKKQWVIDFVEYFNDPDVYAGIGLDKWYTEFEDIWLIIPLTQKNTLEGFVVLTQPRVSRQIDWEDHDLLKTSGMQLANALALTQISDDLSRARQFEAYNRFSAFLVHDLKNLVAQISLIVKNSEKHKRNPEFIDDSIETLENVVKKIDHILGQLKKGNKLENNDSRIDLSKIILDVILQQSSNTPVVTVEKDDNSYWVMAEKEKMTAILGHLVQNAQEATEDTGTVQVTIVNKDSNIIVKIIDSGCGMDEKFIQQRLFKPFDTTKGNAGMGIGVYEAQEYIMQQSGQIDVISEVGKGTIFTVSLPEAV